MPLLVFVLTSLGVYGQNDSSDLTVEKEIFLKDSLQRHFTSQNDSEKVVLYSIQLAQLLSVNGQVDKANEQLSKALLFASDNDINKEEIQLLMLGNYLLNNKKKPAKELFKQWMAEAEKKPSFTGSNWLTIMLLIIFALIFFFIWERKVNKRMKHLNKLLKKRNAQLGVLHKKLVAQKSELIESNQFKEKLLAIVSHDSRSPLNHILSLLPLIENNMINRDELLLLTRNIKAKINDTLGFMDNLLEWAGGQLKGMSLKQEHFDLKLLVNEGIRVMYPLAEAKKIRLINEIDAGTFVKADRSTFMLVIRNLVSNSIKFCNPDDKITISYIEKQDDVIVYVKDTGTGMTEDQLASVFGKGGLSRLGTKEEVGFGLGMLFCREFVERNDGEIWAESDLGSGTKVYFTISKVLSPELI